MDKDQRLLWKVERTGIKGEKATRRGEKRTTQNGARAVETDGTAKGGKTPDSALPVKKITPDQKRRTPRRRGRGEGSWVEHRNARRAKNYPPAISKTSHLNIYRRSGREVLGGESKKPSERGNKTKKNSSAGTGTTELSQRLLRKKSTKGRRSREGGKG